MTEDSNDIMNLLQELGFTSKETYSEAGVVHIFYEKGKTWVHIIVREKP
jgi:hypothetical protein